MTLTTEVYGNWPKTNTDVIRISIYSSRSDPQHDVDLVSLINIVSQMIFFGVKEKFVNLIVLTIHKMVNLLLPQFMHSLGFFLKYHCKYNVNVCYRL